MEACLHSFSHCVFLMCPPHLLTLLFLQALELEMDTYSGIVKEMGTMAESMIKSSHPESKLIKDRQQVFVNLYILFFSVHTLLYDTRLNVLSLACFDLVLLHKFCNCI